ncbi:MAG: hypothetical protein ACLUX8_04970 [Clostridium sp.]
MSSACRFSGACTLYNTYLLIYPVNSQKERIDTMARQKNIKFQMKQELQKMEAYGRSKHADQLKTKEERSTLKAKGVPFEQYRTIDYTRDYIYSYNTMKNYQRIADQYADYLKSHDLNKITLEEAKDHVQEYLDYLRYDKELSPQSIHTSSAGLSKIFHTTMWDYDIPNRSIAKIDRGQHTFSDMTKEQQIEKLAEYPVWNANRVLGMRKIELINLRCDMIKEKDNRIEIVYVGKGGKHNRQIFTDQREIEYIRTLKTDKAPHDRIFDKKEVERTPNLHKARELRCKDVYDRIVADINERGAVAEREYIQQIKQSFKDAHKTLHENLDTPYVVRGDNRQRLLDADRPVEYNRIALMVISTQITQHFRSNVTQNFYVGK